MIAALAWKLEPKSNRTQTAILVLVYIASLGYLVYTLRDAQLGRLIDDISRLNPIVVIFGVCCMIAVYVAQGLRWKLIFAPVAKLGLLPAARAVYVGLFASEVFPFRAGEIIRCYLVSRWTDLPFSVAIASVMIERLFDGLLMWLALKYTLSALHVPTLELAANGLGVFVLVGVIFLGLGLFRPKLKHSEIPASGWRRRLFVLQEDVALIGHSGYLWAALAATIPYLLLQVIPVYLLFLEYNFDLSFGTAVALMMFIRLAAALPQPPATLGLFQLLTREFLERGFSVAPDEAARFSLVLWAMVKLPIISAGAIAALITGARISDLTKAAGEAQKSSR